MHLGISSMNNLHVMRPEVLARALEERGFESLWVGEHSHIPVSRKTPYPAGGELPETYKHMADPFVSLALAATSTKRLKLATGVCLVLERELFTLAKQVATLDQLSNGRVILGIGTGWNEEELVNVSRVPWARRYAGMKDCVAALRALWTQEAAAHQGEFYRFDAVWSYPKPLQKPHPPVVLGVAGRTGVAHAAEWGDGWYPIDVGAKDYGSRIERFRRQVSEAGRDPRQVEITIASWAPDLDRLKRYRDLGVARAVLSTGGGPSKPDSADEMLRLLDRYAGLIPALRS
jgi:probable F420-dependent oxidoreductase